MAHLRSPFCRIDLRIYGGLAFATTAYAVVLERYKWRIEPDWAWAEVVIGALMCLSAAELRMRYERNPTAEGYRRAVWAGFAVGGTPIILWQFWQMSQRYHRAISEWKKDSHGDPTTPLA